MKTLLIDDIFANNPIVVDKEMSSFSKIDNRYRLPNYQIRYIYMLPEDYELRYNDGNNTIIKKVNKGDILIKFELIDGADKHINNFAVIKNKDFFKYMERFVFDKLNKSNELKNAYVCSDCGMYNDCKY